MRIDLMTLFPDMCERVYTESIIGRAIKKGVLTVESHNIRDYSDNKHHNVDDTPYGGGEGMLMSAQPIYGCYESLLKNGKPYVIYMSPKGGVLTQQKAKELAELPHIAILCGHYEGVDQRVLDAIVDEEISIGDYVLTGGELPALVLIDCVARMLDGTLSSEEGRVRESHYNGLLEYPQYTKPAVWHDREVPEVLLSGHHENIAHWRREMSLRETLQKRPDLLEKADLTQQERDFLKKLQKEATQNKQS